MNRAAKRCSAEVITIDDDDVESGEAAAKKPTPSPEVVELREENRKLEAKLQRVIVIAGEKQGRIEFLEQLLDKKPDISAENGRKVEEQEKRIIDLTKGLEEARNRAIEEQKRALEDRMRENARVHDLIEQLEKEQTRASERIADLTKQLDDERRRTAVDRKRALEDRIRDNERIEELTGKLAYFELQSMQIQKEAQPVQQRHPEVQQLQNIPTGLEQNTWKRQPEMQPMQQLKQLQPIPQVLEQNMQQKQPGTLQLQEMPHLERQDMQQLQPVSQLHLPSKQDEDAVTETSSENSVMIDEDPIDIFRLCDSNTENSFSVHGAIMIIRGKLNECGEEQWMRYIGEKNEFLACGVCKVHVRVSHILDHFLATNHEVRALDGAVSFDSLQYWLQQLQLATTAAGAAGEPMQ